MLKEIDLAGALSRIKDGSGSVCMLVPVSKDTTLEELMQAKGFALADTKKEEPKPKAEKPKQEKRKVDHGKIIALHNAGWGPSKIATEVGCSMQTVLNHINAEKNNAEA